MSKKNILIISELPDSNKSTTHLLAEGLLKNGFSVLEVNQISEAKQKLSSQQFSIILVNLKTSIQSGLQLIQQLRNQDFKNLPNNNTPIILLNEHLDINVIRQASTMVQAVLALPIEATELAKQINIQIEKNQPVIQNHKSPEDEFIELNIEYKKFIHDLSGKVMIVGMLLEQLTGQLENKPLQEKEVSLTKKISENIQKINTLIQSVRSTNRNLKKAGN